MARYEDLHVWRMAQRLSIEIDSVCRHLRYEYAFQLRRSSASIADNIAEGAERGSDAQFGYFLGVTLGSCAEAQVQLRRAYRCGDLTEGGFLALLDEAQQVEWMLRAMRRRMHA